MAGAMPTTKRIDPHILGCIRGIASRLPVEQAKRLLREFEAFSGLSVSADNSWIRFELKGYERGCYRGQVPYQIDGQMPDADGALLDVVLHHDHNMRLLDLEMIRWDLKPISKPEWHKVQFK